MNAVGLFGSQAAPARFRVHESGLPHQTERVVSSRPHRCMVFVFATIPEIEVKDIVANFRQKHRL